jgi:hypothetical protein
MDRRLRLLRRQSESLSRSIIYNVVILGQCRRLLGMSPPSEQTDPPPGEKDYRDRYEELTGNSLHQCPQCQQGRMLVVEILPRSLCNSVPPIDSS